MTIINDEKHSIDPEQRLKYLFYTLNLINRLRVSINCNLIYYSDETLTLSQLFQRVFQRAKEQKMFKKLWKEVCYCHDLEDEINPFSD